MDINNVKGYEVVSKQEIKDINSTGYILKHIKTGARVVCISNDDPNKVFYIGFRTPPTDSTGVPHIIEHSVLCGSDKYPAKDPFIELAKGSLNTFLNAMTYPDKTVYPVASCNDQDFKNLVDVYLDAVFHPNIYSRPQIFKQEGWHYELEEADGDITLNGVVYSEMKGAFSSPDDVLDRMVVDSLFPDTCYGVESGGDPDVIPTLTYEDFIAFHKKYYHPSNSYIYLYGDLDIKEQLEYIDENYLDAYDFLEVDSLIEMQKPFDKANEIKKDYPITNDEPLEDNTYIAYNTVIDNALNKELYVAFQVIDYALISSPGAILKKALLDSGICKDVQGGYDNGILQPYFSIVVKNTNEESKEQFISIIKDVLTDIVKNGIDKKAILAGINLFEFKFREADFGHYPKGLMYGLQTLDSWLYDDNAPFMHIQPLDTFEFLKQQINTNYYEDIIDKYLLNNAHESIVVMTPNRGLTAKKDSELAAKLSAYKDTLSKEDIKELISKTNELHKYQQEEDDEEILALIPCLKISDIKKEAARFVYTEHKEDDLTILTHDIFTNNIGYLSVNFDVTDFPMDIIPYMGLIKSMLGYLNTTNYSYTDLANEIFLNSGGIAPSLDAYTDCFEKDKFVNVFSMKAKILYDKLDFAFDMINEIVFGSQFDDKKRVYEILCMLKSRMQGAMVSSGHTISAHRAMAHISKVDAVLEKTGGIDFYRFVEDITADFDNKAGEIIANLKKVRDMIFNKKNLLLIDYTATADQYDVLSKMAKNFKDNLPDESNYETDEYDVSDMISEAYKTGAKVQYVACAGRYIDDKHPYTGALSVLKVIMGYDYLWNQVRVLGGAYGAFANFTKTGEAYFTSYRDPNLKRTLEVYKNAAEYLRNFEASERDMTKYIIGTVANLDIPRTPSQEGSRGLEAYLTHNTYERIQKNRDDILGANKESIRKLSEYIDNFFKSYSVCVIGSEEMIETEKDMFDNVEPLFKN